MKRIISVLLVILCMASCYVTAQTQHHDNENYRYFKAREIVENKGNRKEAKELLDENIEEYPKHIQSYLLLTGMLRSEGSYGNALNIIEKAIKNNHKASDISDITLMWWKASIYEDMNQDNEALAIMQNVVKSARRSKDENLVEMLESLAQLHYNLEQYSESDKVYEELRKIDHGSQLPMVGLARNMIAREEYDEALQLLEDCKKYDEDYAEIYRFQMRAFEGKEEYRNMIQAMLTLYDKSEDFDYLDTDVFLKDRYYSIAALKERVSSSSDNDIWKLVLSAVYARAYMHANAIPLLNALIKDYGNNPELLKQRAESYEELGLLDNAISDMTVALENSKGDEVAYNHAVRSRIYKTAGKYEEALKDIEVFIERFPTRSYGYSMRGSLKEQMGDRDGALEDYNEGISMNPDYAYLYLRRGKLYSQMDINDLAEQDFQKLIQIDTTVESSSCRNYGLLFQMKYEEAFEWNDKIIEADPYDPVHVYDKACMYSLIGDSEEALVALEEAFKNGFRKFTHIENDSDLDFIRVRGTVTGERYEELIRKYQLIHEKELSQFLSVTESNSSSGSITEVSMIKKYSGTYEIPCKVNELPLKMIFDTGASDVTISSVEASFMFKNGYLSDDDVKGKQHYMTASGEIHEGTVIRLKEVKIGEATLKNIEASVVHNQKAPLLLGQSALEKFGTITIDNVNTKLIIKQ